MYCISFLLAIILNQLILIFSQVDNATLSGEMELQHCVRDCYDDKEALTTSNIARSTQESVTKDAPEFTPTNVHVRMINLTTLRISWYPPPTQSLHGRPLKGYKIDVLGSDTRYHRNIMTNERATTITLFHLVPKMSYRVRVAAFTVAETGKYHGSDVVTMTNRLLIIGGGWVEVFGKKTFEIVDLQNPRHNHVVNATLNFNRGDHMSGVFSNGKVVIAGGMKGVYAINSTEFFDTSTNKVTQGPDMNEKRKQAGGAILNDAFYVCGGYGGYRKHSSCERLVKDGCREPKDLGIFCEDIQTQYYYDNSVKQCKSVLYSGCGSSSNNFDSFEDCQDACVFHNTFKSASWEFIAPLAVKRSELQMVALDNHLYAIGGDDSQCGCVVEKYFPMNNSWTRVKDMQRGRLRFGATAFNGKIYVCGGKSFDWQSLPLNECEMYDPITDQWTNIAPMKKQRRCLAMTSINGFIYAAGDCWHVDHKVIVERYDPVNNNWTVIDDYKLIHPRYRFTMHPI